MFGSTGAGSFGIALRTLKMNPLSVPHKVTTITNVGDEVQRPFRDPRTVLSSLIADMLAVADFEGVSTVPDLGEFFDSPSEGMLPFISGACLKTLY